MWDSPLDLAFTTHCLPPTSFFWLRIFLGFFVPLGNRKTTGMIGVVPHSQIEVGRVRVV